MVGGSTQPKFKAPNGKIPRFNFSTAHPKKKEKKSEKLKLKQSEKNAPNNAHTHTQRHTL